MVGTYIDKKAKLGPNVYIGEYTHVLGPSIIENSVYIDNNVVIGYPVRAKIKGIQRGEIKEIETEGSFIGEGSIIRSYSIIYEKVKIGRNVETGHRVLIREETEIGDSSVVGTDTVIDGRVKIGVGARIETGVYIPPLTIIGRNVFLGPRVVFTNDKYPVSRRLVGAVVEDNVAIGANATIIAGVRIGEGAVVASGAVITKDVKPRTVVAGVPARYLMSREEFEEKKKKYESLLID